MLAGSLTTLTAREWSLFVLKLYDNVDVYEENCLVFR